jgi:N-methylhydantoinase B
MPDAVPAEGTSNLWNLSLLAGHGLTDSGGSGARSFNVTSFHSGGAGARPRLDGLSATPFPSGVRSVPVEITEAITPLVIWRKELRAGSGGPGRQRGGLGQRMVIGSREPAAFGIQARFERAVYPARGRHGGQPGATGRLSLGSGGAMNPKGFQVIPAGDRLVVEMPGGGGYGEPWQRDPTLVARDLQHGLITAEEAEATYGVVLGTDGSPDMARTNQRRTEEKLLTPSVAGS